MAAQTQGEEASVDIHVSVPDSRDRAWAKVAVALVQDRLVSEVKAGENAGKRLSHDYVVRQWRAGLPLDAAGELRKSLDFALPHEPGQLSIVAFAEDAASGDVLQALALPLCATAK